MTTPNVFNFNDFPASIFLVSLMGAIAISKFLFPKAFNQWNNFADSPQQVIDGSWWCVVASSVTHADLKHFAHNIMFFLSFSFSLEQEFGSSILFMCFLGAHLTGFVLRTLLNCYLHPDVFMFMGGLGCSSVTYLFSFLMCVHVPAAKAVLFGNAYLWLLFSHWIPHIIGRSKQKDGKYRFDIKILLQDSIAIALMSLVVACLFPNSATLMNYVTLHFSICMILRLKNRLSSRADGSDHVLHFVCSSSGALFALCFFPGPFNVRQTIQIALIWMVLAARVFSPQFSL